MKTTNLICADIIKIDYELTPRICNTTTLQWKAILLEIYNQLVSIQRMTL